MQNRRVFNNKSSTDSERKFLSHTELERSSALFASKRGTEQLESNQQIHIQPTSLLNDQYEPLNQLSSSRRHLHDSSNERQSLKMNKDNCSAAPASGNMKYINEFVNQKNSVLSSDVHSSKLSKDMMM